MKKAFLFLAVLVIGFGGVFLLSNTLEKNKPKIEEKFADEDLYFSATQLKAVGHDFRGLIADWYWINSLQYLGYKLLNYQGEININDLRPLNPRLIYPMLDTAVTLDPQFMTVYSYGASILPAIDTQAAIKLIEKGIIANPDNWRLYHSLGYIYWQIKDFPKAAKIYAEGAQKPGAPVWMKQMSVTMQAQGASREFAREIYKQMYETAEDEQTKSLADLRFAQIVSLDERDAMNIVLQNFQKQNGRCANSWREILSGLQKLRLPGNSPLRFDSSSQTPIDSTGVPYFLKNQNSSCEITLDYLKSKIPPN